jgi:dTDP-4-amino-4,6-dideoxygalactose transaminase
VGTFGDLATWSFYPTKNLGCFGDGGAVTGAGAERLERVRRLANHGQSGRYHHLLVGTNSRLDSLQAAVLNCRLALLEGDNARRREIACRYWGGLAGAGDVALLEDPPGAFSGYHQFTLRTARRDALAAHLAARGIGCAVHYPEPRHRQPALAHLAPDADLPVAEAAAREVLCLPIFPEMTDEEVDEVSAAVQDFYRQR